MSLSSSLKTGCTAAILALTLAAGLCAPSYAQLSNVDLAKARAHFSNAQDSFKSGDYTQTLDHLDKAVEISGETGTRILALEARALYKLERYEDTMAVLDEFYASGPSDSDKLVIDPILLEIDSKLAAERARKQKAAADALEAERLAPLIAAEKARKGELMQSNPFTATSRLIKPGRNGSSGNSGDQGRRGKNGGWVRQRVAIPGISASISSPAYNEKGFKAGPGTHGGNGSQGSRGGKIRLTIREVPMEYTAPLGFIEVLDFDSRDVLASGYWDFANTLKIDATGGDGGRGGSGGKGGTGGSGADGSYEARRSSTAGEGGPGGKGGDGGDGARGGDGGTVKIQIIGSVAFKDGVLKNLNSDVSGGSGGQAGSAGRAGEGGQGGRHASGRRAYRGSDGYRGRSGSSGRDGSKGSSTYTRKTQAQLQAEIDEKEAQAEAARREAERAAEQARLDAERAAEAARLEAERVAEEKRLATEARNRHFAVVSNFAYTKPASKTAYNAGDMAVVRACALAFSTGPTDDVDAAPCIRTGPVMPQAATTSGHCQMRFDVNQQGHTENIEVTGCTDPVFAAPSLTAVNQWFFTPRITGGTVVNRPGIESKLSFDLTDQAGNLIPEPAGQTLKPVTNATLNSDYIVYPGMENNYLEFVLRCTPNHSHSGVLQRPSSNTVKIGSWGQNEAGKDVYLYTTISASTDQSGAPNRAVIDYREVYDFICSKESSAQMNAENLAAIDKALMGIKELTDAASQQPGTDIPCLCRQDMDEPVTKALSMTKTNAVVAKGSGFCGSNAVVEFTEDQYATPCVRIPPIMPTRAETSGHCRVHVDVDVKGRPTDTRVRGCTDPVFAGPTLASVSQWLFSPRVENGKIVPEFNSEVRVTYRLADEKGNIIPEPPNSYQTYK